MTTPIRGEQNLARLLGSLSPNIDPETWWFCHLAPGAVPAGLPVLARIDEEEGATLIVSAKVGAGASLSPTFVARRIVLTVHSDLAAVGMMAAVAKALAEVGLPCNVFAGIYHDHLFLSPEDAPRAMVALDELQASARSGVRIDYLSDHPQAIELLGEWHFAEWQALIPGWSIRKAIADLTTHGRGTIPTTFVALHGAEVVGSASLLVEDIPGTEAWSPWLASVYVRPEWRSRGIGRRLVRRVVAEAERLGVETLHLFTSEAEGWYRGQDWRVIERRSHAGTTATIMDLDLSRLHATFQQQAPPP